MGGGVLTQLKKGASEVCSTSLLSNKCLSMSAVCFNQCLQTDSIGMHSKKLVTKCTDSSKVADQESLRVRQGNYQCNNINNVSVLLK